MTHWYQPPKKKSKYDALETLELIKRLWDVAGLGEDQGESERAYAGLVELIEREKKSRAAQRAAQRKSNLTA
jgi:hypothetical protein